MDEFAVASSQLLREALDWLRTHYERYEFCVERDLVWTVQTQLRRLVCERGLPFLVLSEYPLLAGPRRALCADLVIRERRTGAMVAAEFKYEPHHQRPEFLAMPNKLPVVSWGADGVAKDIERIRTFVEAGVVSTAHAVFVDEGRHFRHRAAHPGSIWEDWNDAGPSILRAEYPTSYGSLVVGHRAEPSEVVSMSGGCLAAWLVFGRLPWRSTGWWRSALGLGGSRLGLSWRGSSMSCRLNWT